MATRRSSRTFRVRGPRRRLVWARQFNTAAGTNIPANGSIFSDLLSDYVTQAGGDSLAGCTVMRIRGNLWSRPTGGLGSMVGWGIRKDDQASVTATATPQPYTTGRYMDWMARGLLVWDSYLVPAAGTVVTPTIMGNNQAAVIDVKSRRKVDELNESIFLCMQELTGNSVNIFIDLSLLVALP
jgi:hypothetical protein